MAAFDQNALPALLARYYKLPEWDQGYLSLDLQRRDFASLAQRVALAEQKVENSTVKEYHDDELSIIRRPFLRSQGYRRDEFQYDVTATRAKLEELDILGPLAFPSGRKRSAYVCDELPPDSDQYRRSWSLSAIKGGRWTLSFSVGERHEAMDSILAGSTRGRCHLRLVWSA